MIDAVICEPVRTPVGRLGGVFKDIPAATLAETVMRGLVGRTGLGGGDVDDVIFGQCSPNGEAPAIGRIAALDAGLGIQTPGVQVDRRCGSGLQALIDAALRIQTGAADLIIAGGVESMSQAEHYVLGGRFGFKGDSQRLWDRLARARLTAGGRHYPVAGGMIETAENLRRDLAIPREAQDELAVSSHARAIAAQREGRFTDEIIPVAVKQRGETIMVNADEHPRADVNLESLAKLKPIMLGSDRDATVTAGNASGQNDGAAACIVTTRARADALGLRPLARLVSWATAGVEPSRMGLGPVPATARALERAGLTLQQIDLIELNEAFAAQVIACTRAWQFSAADCARINVNGSAISLGHPLGATGMRVAATMLRELDRSKDRYALETMCIGGGQGLAAVFERLD